MRYRLRTLMIVLALGPPVLAPLMLRAWRDYIARRAQQPTKFHVPTPRDKWVSDG